MTRSGWTTGIWTIPAAVSSPCLTRWFGCSITGEEPPPAPVTAREYGRAGLRWWDDYNEGALASSGSKKLAGLKSVTETGHSKGNHPLSENESVTAEKIVELRKALKPGQVREGAF